MTKNTNPTYCNGRIGPGAARLREKGGTIQERLVKAMFEAGGATTFGDLPTPEMQATFERIYDATTKPSEPMPEGYSKGWAIGRS